MKISNEAKIINAVLNFGMSSELQPSYDLSYGDVFMNGISVVFRLVGFAVNINSAYQYYSNDQNTYFLWTLFSLLVPGIVTITISLQIYLDDVKCGRIVKKNYIQIFFFVILFPYLFRYHKALGYAIRSKMAKSKNDRENQIKYYDLMVHEDSDLALIRIFECFQELAPQKILQFTIMLTTGEPKVHQIIVIISAVFSMTWCLVSYYQCIRFTQLDKKPVSWFGTITQCVWHFFISISRIVSISIAASVFPQYTFIGCAVHAFAMALWIVSFDRSTFCSTTFFHSFMFSLVLGIVYIFSYILPKEGPTFWRYLIYYLICGFENISCVIIFALFSSLMKVLVIVFSLLATVPFMLGIISMIIFYKYLHPNITNRRHMVEDNEVISIKERDSLNNGT